MQWEVALTPVTPRVYYTDDDDDDDDEGKGVAGVIEWYGTGELKWILRVQSIYTSFVVVFSIFKFSSWWFKFHLFLGWNIARAHLR